MAISDGVRGQPRCSQSVATPTSAPATNAAGTSYGASVGDVVSPVGARSTAAVMRHLADSHVVQAFNDIAFFGLGALARPAGDPDRSGAGVAAGPPNP